MNVVCETGECPIILNSKCVIYEGEALVYTGINTNDSIQTVIQKLNTILEQQEGGGDAVWGEIGGELSNQNDLITYLTSTYYNVSNPLNYISRLGISGGTGISYNSTTGVITNTAIGIGGSTGSEDNTFLSSDGTGGSTVKAAPMTFDINTGAGANIYNLTGETGQTRRQIVPTGSESNITLELYSKGTGSIRIIDSGGGISLEGVTTFGNVDSLSGYNSLRYSNNILRPIGEPGNPFMIRGWEGTSSGEDGIDVQIYGGSGYQLSGDSNGGNLILGSGGGNGSGIDGDVIVDPNNGFVDFKITPLEDMAPIINHKIPVKINGVVYYILLTDTL